MSVINMKKLYREYLTFNVDRNLGVRDEDLTIMARVELIPGSVKWASQGKSKNKREIKRKVNFIKSDTNCSEARAQVRLTVQNEQGIKTTLESGIIKGLQEAKIDIPIERGRNMLERFGSTMVVDLVQASSETMKPVRKFLPYEWDIGRGTSSVEFKNEETEYKARLQFDVAITGIMVVRFSNGMIQQHNIVEVIRDLQGRTCIDYRPQELESLRVTCGLVQLTVQGKAKFRWHGAHSFQHK